MKVQKFFQLIFPIKRKMYCLVFMKVLFSLFQQLDFCKYSELSFFFTLYIFSKYKSFSLHSILHVYVFIPDRQQTLILTPSIYLSLGSMLFVSNLLSLCNFYVLIFINFLKTSVFKSFSVSEEIQD